MRKINIILISLFCFVIAFAHSVAEQMTVQDLKEQINWINVTALELAIKDMSEQAGYDKDVAIAKLSNLKDLIDKGFNGLDANNIDAIQRARTALKLYKDILLLNPLLKNTTIVACKYQLGNIARSAMAPKLGTPSNNWTNQQSNEYHGYNASIVKLKNIGEETSIQTVYTPKNGAVIADLRLHWDGDHLIFTSVTEDERLNVYGGSINDGKFTPLIVTEEPDLEFYDGIYLPDGRILAVSNIGYQAVPCIHGDGPVGNMVLYDPKTKKLRRLTFDQDANWNPVVNNAGKVLYTRWEYTDLMHYYSRFVMHMNPDGTEQKALYGSGTLFPNSTFDVQPLPNHNSAFIGVISGHHGVARSGRLIIFDPNKARKGVEGMLQELPYKDRKIEAIAKDRLVDGVWPQFLRPMPVDDKTFLVTAKLSSKSLWGIYLIDVYDNLVCLYQEQEAGFINPLLLKERKMPPVIPDRVNLEDREATVFIQDIYNGEGLRGVPRGVVKSLRLHAYEYAYVKSPSNHEGMGIQSGWDIKRNLGTVPIEEDGSAIFKIPANTPISIQPLDKDGRAIQWMRSWLTGQPGEIVSCVGCHEDQNTIAIPKRVIASTKTPSKLTPPEGGIRPFTFDLEVQPILDRACISCHDGSKHPMDLRGGKKTDRGLRSKMGAPKGFYRYGYPEYSTSYMALHPYVHRQGSEADMAVLQPYEYYANTSELIRMLEVGHYNVKLTPKEWQSLTNWIDYNAPCSGVYTNIQPLKGIDQYKRRIELGNKYANTSVDWKAELENYTEYLKNNKGEINPDNHRQIDREKVKYIKIPNWPISPNDLLLKENEKEKIVEIIPGVSIRFVRIPAGNFIMGSNDGVLNNRPAHKAKISSAFWMAEMEITNEQYNALVPEHNSRYVDQFWKDHVNEGYPANLPNQPVIRVSLQDAEKFCSILSEKTGLPITLPTEEQWEWACRAGSDNDFWFGDINCDFGKMENLADVNLEKMAVQGIDPQPMQRTNPLFESYNFIPKNDRVDDGAMITTNSDNYQPNPFGLYSMHGNVAEWTKSPYILYSEKGDEFEKYVVRGGSYIDRPKYATSYTRKAYFPWQRVYNVGFRVVINE
ncbi:MAG: SUMF1/EgtB/PvdO family nonheme iron enzyme [Parabacteroides sp.]|nr:SUMF1/EgtB/PvdO family nonheme iron enzyme [Parabacteroides sp.]